MEIFNFRVAGDIHFGAGVIERVGKALKNKGGRKILVVADPGFAKTAPFRKITGALEKEALSFVVFNGVEPEPRTGIADQCGEIARKEKCDFVLGIGGGSAMDTAKAAAILATNGGQAMDYLGMDRVPHPGLPKAMVPTTAGTGSEVTFTAVFINEQERKKGGINSPYLYPDFSFLDPELTVGLPPAITAYTGMDALAHGIESYLSKAASPVSEIISLEAIRRIGRSLRRAVQEGGDLQARTDMLLGSFLAGIGLANAGVTAVHSLSYPLGGVYRVPHGVGNGLLLAAVMEYNLASCPEKLSRVAEALGEEIGGRPKEQGAMRAVHGVRKLGSDLGVPQHLSDLGVPESAFPGMAEEALKVSRPLENNPRPVSLEGAIQIYRRVF
jgi:alcohol dehydrogenase class IV